MSLRSRLYSLRVALLLYVVLPLVAVLAVAGWAGLRVMEGWVEDRMEKEVELVAQAIRIPLARSLERRRERTVARTLESAFDLSEVYALHMFDLEGNELAAVGVQEPPEEPEKISEIAREGDRTGEYGEVGGREAYSYFVPLSGSGGQSIGLLQLSRRRADFRDEFRRIRIQGGGLLAAGALLMGGLVLFGHHGSVGRHLDRLQRTMRRVKEGDRNHRATVAGPRELAAVATRFNEMLDTMAEAEAEIRERKSTQQALESRLRRAEKLAAVGRLAAGVAHELGSPLSVVSGKAQRWLRRSDRLPGELEEDLRETRSQVDRMKHLVEQLLEFGRGGELEREPVRADRLVAAAADHERGLARERGVTIEVEGPSGASPTAPGDRARLQRALANLVRNAVQAADARVRVTWTRWEEGIAFRVDDDGPGINPGVENRLFEPFFTTRRGDHGTGLGLAVVHGVVEDHGGRVEVGASEWGGASFTVYLTDEGAAGGAGPAAGGTA